MRCCELMGKGATDSDMWITPESVKAQEVEEAEGH